MLLLIAGISGKFGHYLADAALRRGLQVRGLGRSPQKVEQRIADSLESFVTSTGTFDVGAIQKAVTGVDAVICSYAATPEFYLEAQLFLLRQAEKAGVRIFLAQSWNFNWHNINFGDMEYYDANISFCRQVELTSNIRPVYIFSGLFSHRIYVPTSPICFALRDGSAVMEYWGDGEAKFPWTSMENDAEYTIEILTTEPDVLAGNGGFFCVQSGCNTIKEFAEVYEKVKGVKVELIRRGDVKDLEAKIRGLRESFPPQKYFQYLRYVLVLLAIKGKWVVENFRPFDHIPKTKLEDVVLNDKKIEGPYSLEKV